MGAVREKGSAVIAAVLCSAAFALVAEQMVRTSRSGIQSANADAVHAQLEADLDAGLAMAVNNLTARDGRTRWDIDGSSHTISFDGSELVIRVEDERGKVPLNSIQAPQIQRLFQRAGAPPEAVADLVQAFLDVRDPLRDRGPGAALRGAAAAAPAGEGGFRTVEELAKVPGMTPALYSTLLPAVTVNNGNAPFDARTASPLAIDVMSQQAFGGVQAIERQRALAGERPALAGRDELGLIGRPLTVRIQASDAGDNRAQAVDIIELTGRGDQPFIVRRRGANS